VNEWSTEIAPEPPPAPKPPTDFALQDFDEAISTLKRLMTKLSAQFVGTTHRAHDLEKVEDFLRAVVKAKATRCAIQVPAGAHIEGGN
jgi:hypothetical protein